MPGFLRIAGNDRGIGAVSSIVEGLLRTACSIVAEANILDTAGLPWVAVRSVKHGALTERLGGAEAVPNSENSRHVAIFTSCHGSPAFTSVPRISDKMYNVNIWHSNRHATGASLTLTETQISRPLEGLPPQVPSFLQDILKSFPS
jgi:hypothetical protein